MIDSDVPLPVVGGPLHGSFYSHSGRFLEVYEEEDVHIYSGAPGDIRKLAKTHAYSRRYLEFAYGALRLEGWAWVSQSLRCDEKAMRLAIGLMIGAALKISDDV